MCKIIDELNREAREEGRIEGKIEGIKTGKIEMKTKIKFIKPYLEKYSDNSLIAKETNWPLEEIQEYRDLLS